MQITTMDKSKILTFSEKVFTISSYLVAWSLTKAEMAIRAPHRDRGRLQKKGHEEEVTDSIDAK